SSCCDFGAHADRLELVSGGVYDGALDLDVLPLASLWGNGEDVLATQPGGSFRDSALRHGADQQRAHTHPVRVRDVEDLSEVLWNHRRGGRDQRPARLVPLGFVKELAGVLLVRLV